ncbi:MAG: hypothetical protein H8K06_21230 [Nitrospira sp.]|uniref:Lipoprotein n=1 Tax=Nitrospira defluvii TaxID=330214 RepID=A0ABN7MA69_9BACT|nr:hypothetical protein [Nitrospira defluvii]MCS6329572.1 hypothetical protein [Nitrospira sp.]CAE6793587.1 hypothetical protein NSPZN2_60126 [Nitrospira defluvii]
MFYFSADMTLRFGLLVTLLLTSACGFKSTTFIGVHGMGTQKMFGVVAQSAVDPVDQFLKDWLAQWEKGSCSACYTHLSDVAKNDVSPSKFNEAVEDLTARFGLPQHMTSLDQPMAMMLPRMDEALLERSTDAALKYYSYVVTTYLSHRPTKNLVYVLAVGMKGGQLSILGFAIFEQIQSLNERPSKVYGFGIPL